jgi:DNA polymerase alpha subunit A
MAQVKQEVDSLMAKYKIATYRTRVVKKLYAFDRRSNSKQPQLDEEIPYESEYLEIEYNVPQNSSNHHANQSHQLPGDLQGEYFSCLLGSQTSYLEHLLIDLKIKGPCWLLVNNAKSNTNAMVSWCKLEYNIDNYRTVNLYHENVMIDHPNIQLPTTPPLTILSLSIKTMLNTKTQEHEIICACGLVSNKFYLEKAASANNVII